MSDIPSSSSCIIVTILGTRHLTFATWVCAFILAISCKLGLGLGLGKRPDRQLTAQRKVQSADGHFVVQMAQGYNFLSGCSECQAVVSVVEKPAGPNPTGQASGWIGPSPLNSSINSHARRYSNTSYHDQSQSHPLYHRLLCRIQNEPNCCAAAWLSCCLGSRNIRCR